MSNETLEAVIVTATEQTTVENLNEVTATLVPLQEMPPSTTALLDTLIDSVTRLIDKDPNLTKAYINMCAKLSYNSTSCRGTLQAAIKLQLPPYLAKQGFQRALGIRERSNTPAEIVKRFYVLLELTSGCYCYNPEGKVFAKIEHIDDLAGSIGLTTLTQPSSYRVQLEQVLSTFTLFKPTHVTKKLLTIASASAYTSIAWRDAIESVALTRISENTMKELGRTVFVPAVMNLEAFNAWWVSTVGVVEKKNAHERQAGDARSLLELTLIINKNKSEDESFKIQDADVPRLKILFSRQRPPVTLKDMQHIADALATLETVASYAQLEIILDAYKHKMPFWPTEIKAEIDLNNLELWGALNADVSRSLLKVTEAVFSKAYLASLSTVLPLKSLNALFSLLEEDYIHKAMFDSPYFSSDSLMWIWKNRKGAGKPFLNVLDMDRVINAMLLPNLPKAWTSAQRELKKSLIEDGGLLKVIVDNHDDVRTIIYAVQRAKGFSQGEQQSLLVKLSRHSEDLKLFLEGGEGQRLMSAVNSKTEQQEKIDPYICSLKSYHAHQAQLDNVLNVQTPANRRAIEEARAHGDFSENAEYDAAKEVRRYLNAQRGKLEHELLNAQPIDFRTVEVTDRVVPGSYVMLQDTEGQALEYFVVGAWDSDVERNWIAYASPIGLVLKNQGVGSEVDLPNGTHAKITKVTALPEAVLKELEV